MRIVQISDTHLSHLGGPTNDNLERLIPFVNDQLRPDLVVHSGDVLIADPDSAADRAAARELLSGITAPLRVVPGNHDVGEPGDEPWGGLGTTSARVAAFAGAFGPDHWLELGDYAVIGLNSEVLSTGLPEEQAQWDWLETVPAPGRRAAGAGVLAQAVLAAGARPGRERVEHPRPGTVPAAARPGRPGRPGLRERPPAPVLPRALRRRAHRHRAVHRLRRPVGRAPDRATGSSRPGSWSTGARTAAVDVYFRSVPGLAERSPFDTEQFLTTARSVGVTFGD